MGPIFRQTNKNRVDFQVAIMNSCIVIIVSVLVFGCTYFLSYQDMIKGLQDRVSAIYSGLEEQIDVCDFEKLNTTEDVHQDAYIEMQAILQKAKETSGVKYLYTAKVLESGEFVYVVDGLSPDSADYRYPGDLIEPEIQEEMRRALTSEIVMPSEIKHTSWGHIFIAYLPLHHGDEVMGVLGVEFDAGHQFLTYQYLMIGVPIMILIFCGLGCLVAVKLFRRISNPHYKDFSNTDMLTGLKNRNAFETDRNNLNGRDKSKISIIFIDLDDLKVINDSQGHLVGDCYIRKCVTILQQSIMPQSVLYRVGGDEFVIVVHDSKRFSPEKLIGRIEQNLFQANKTPIEDAVEALDHVQTTLELKISLTVGHAEFDEKQDMDLLDTYNRADSNMYQLKRQKKQNKGLYEEKRKAKEETFLNQS